MIHPPTKQRLGGVLAALATGTASLTGMVAIAPSANAATARNGVCEDGEACYYYNSNEQGSVSDFSESLANYGDQEPACFDFKGPGAGRGLCIKNHAASVDNRTNQTLRIYLDSEYQGTHQDIAPHTKANLIPALHNNNASHEFIGTAAPSPTGCTTDGTQTRAPSSILVYRVAAKRVDRVAFKDYVKDVLPNEWIPSWPTESLRSGAMAAKTYGWYWALHSTRKTVNGACYDVRDDTGDQRYLPGKQTTGTSNAVDSTWNERLTRGGAIFEPHYCSTTTACGAWHDGDWLSQYGSADMAHTGATYKQILSHYYPGATVTP